MTSTIKEIVSLHWLRADMRISFTHSTRMYCDNHISIQSAYNLIFHERTKHIEIDCHIVREKLLAGIISTSHVPSHAQLADIFTKALGRNNFQLMSSKLGLHNIHSPT